MSEWISVGNNLFESRESKRDAQKRLFKMGMKINRMPTNKPKKTFVKEEKAESD